MGTSGQSTQGLSKEWQEVNVLTGQRGDGLHHARGTRTSDADSEVSRDGVSGSALWRFTNLLPAEPD